MSIVVLFQTACHTLAKIPVHKTELMIALQDILERLLTKCDVRYQGTILIIIGVIAGSENDDAEDAPSSNVSSEWATENDIQSLLRQNTYLDSEMVFGT